MEDELLYQIALTLVPNIGDVHAKELISRFECASNIFKAKRKDLESIEGIGTIRIKSILDFKDFKRAEEEVKFIKKFKISALFISDPRYPQRLLNCFDPPTLLFFKGNADLNASKIIAVVGTRKNNEYGKLLCEKTISELASENVLIVSGLAFGIDTIAHKTALKNNLNTIGVVAHGLDRLYPPENKNLAIEMIEQGGILSEFKSDTNPDKQNFPKRNRIVAGMCDAVLVIESGLKGGSLITAELGNSYNKDVFAFPGRVGDSRSEGCNYLIKNNKAAMVTSAKDILENLGWISQKKEVKRQRELFIDFTNEERIIIDILKNTEEMHIDQLYQKSKLSSSAIASALLTLEMQGVVATLPGKMYKQV